MSGCRNQLSARVWSPTPMLAAIRRRWSRSPPSTAPLPGSPLANTSSPYFLPELIPKVARRLTSLQDFFALRAACRTYRALVLLAASNLASPALLLLLIPRDRTQPHGVFRFPLRWIHRFCLPRTSIANTEAGRFFTEESHTLGCCLAIHNHTPCRYPPHNLSIVHLLTGERAYLRNPPGPFSRLLLFGDLAVSWGHDDMKFQSDIQYYRLGTSRWRLATIRFPNQLEDLIFVKGTHYALVNPGYRLAVVELPEDEDNYYGNNLKLAFLGRQFDTQDHEQSVFCLAECCGELLLIIRRAGGPLVLQWQAGEGTWVRVTSLDGCTLFFTESLFSGCLGPNHPGFKGDCIYITHLRSCVVFSLVNQCPDVISVDDPRGPESYCWPPLWVFPSMC